MFVRPCARSTRSLSRCCATSRTDLLVCVSGFDGSAFDPNGRHNLTADGMRVASFGPSAGAHSGGRLPARLLRVAPARAGGGPAAAAGAVARGPAGLRADDPQLADGWISARRAVTPGPWGAATCRSRCSVGSSRAALAVPVEDVDLAVVRIFVPPAAMRAAPMILDTSTRRCTEWRISASRWSISSLSALMSGSVVVSIVVSTLRVRRKRRSPGVRGLRGFVVAFQR